MVTSRAFKVALLCEAIAWLAVGDVRICVFYGVLVFGSCRLLYRAKEFLQ